jgi:predicted ArsR family transcriptional regulator
MTVYSTRRTVLRTLKELGQATVNQLAQAVGIKPVTLRHHLNVLQAEGLLTVEERRQAVGRPIYVYALSQQAEGLFPRPYRLSVGHVLVQIRNSLSPGTMEMLVRLITDGLVEEMREQFSALPFEDRLPRLLEILEQEGFTARLHTTDDGTQLLEYQCPYHPLGQRYPELCRIDETLIREAVNMTVKRGGCLLAGDPSCTFILLGDHSKR